MRRQQLLVSVRGKREALAAVRGGAHIADVEFPASALGTSYPLNIAAVRNALDTAGFQTIPLSTNIGEIQQARASACQAALGVATAGANIIKFGLGELPIQAAIYQGREIVRTVRKWYRNKQLLPAVFVDPSMQRYLNVCKESPELGRRISADGILIDTFEKGTGKGLLDYCRVDDIALWCRRLHALGLKAWVAGSITQARTASDMGCGCRRRVYSRGSMFTAEGQRALWRNQH